MSSTKSQQSESADFFEELPDSYEQSYHEAIHGLSSYNDTGLREDEVHKLTDDIFNPMPPAESDA